jgi:hypothetical protein
MAVSYAFKDYKILNSCFLSDSSVVEFLLWEIIKCKRSPVRSRVKPITKRYFLHISSTPNLSYKGQFFLEFFLNHLFNPYEGIIIS